MGKSKQDKTILDKYVIELEIKDAKSSIRRAVLWFCIYTAIIVLGYLFVWRKSVYAMTGFSEYFAAFGAISIFIFAVIYVALLFWRFTRKQLERLVFYTLLDLAFALLISFFGTALAVFCPVLLIGGVIEVIEPLHLWLSAPIDSILLCRGYFLLACAATLIPYIILGFKFLKGWIILAYYSNLEKLEDARVAKKVSEYYAANDAAQKASWEKLKQQRREAERRKREESISVADELSFLDETDN